MQRDAVDVGALAGHGHPLHAVTRVRIETGEHERRGAVSRAGLQADDGEQCLCAVVSDDAVHHGVMVGRPVDTHEFTGVQQRAHRLGERDPFGQLCPHLG